MKRFRKVLIVLLAILVPVSIGFGFNFFNKEINSTSNKQNKTMIVDGELKINEDNIANVNNLFPGDKICDDVTLNIKSTAVSLLRAKVNVYYGEIGGEINKSAADICSINGIDETKWKKGSDGCYRSMVSSWLPFLKVFIERLKKLNVKLFINPDGLEHKRLKWNCYIRKYLKYSERVMVKYADLVICDSLNIEKYIKEEYKKYKPKTEFIAYGAEIKSNPSENNEKLNKWYKEKGIKKGQYYVSVGRFVPENNYETMIKEFMKSNTKKDFVIITNYEKNKFYQQLNVSTNFQKDKRIKFVGTVYDQELLTKIRENAYGYIHGHEVGGTNPSLLEALATTKLNLLLGVGFNKEVAETAGIYWTKGNGSLSRLIDNTDYLPINTIYEYSKKSKDRIKNYYNWPMITLQYEKLFEDTSLLFRTSAI